MTVLTTLDRPLDVVHEVTSEQSLALSYAIGMDGTLAPMCPVRKRPFHCRKHQACRMFLRASRTATTDVETLLRALHHHPRNLVGYFPGATVLGLDFDSRESLDAFLAALAPLDPLRLLPVVRSPRGWHLYLTVDPGGRYEKRPDVDLRTGGTNGLILPGQTRADGGRYVLVSGTLSEAPPRLDAAADHFRVAPRSKSALPGEGRASGVCNTPEDRFVPTGEDSLTRFLERVENVTVRRGAGTVSVSTGERDRSADLAAVWRCGEWEGLSAFEMAAAVETYLPPLVREVALERGGSWLLEDAERMLLKEHRSPVGRAGKGPRSAAFSPTVALTLLDRSGLTPARVAALRPVVETIVALAVRSGVEADEHGVVTVDVGVEHLSALLERTDKMWASRALRDLTAAGAITKTRRHFFDPDDPSANRVRGYAVAGVGVRPEPLVDRVAPRPLKRRSESALPEEGRASGVCNTLAEVEARAERRRRETVRQTSEAAVSRRTKRTDLDDIERYGLGTEEGDAAYERVHGVRPEAHAAGGLYRRAPRG